MNDNVTELNPKVEYLVKFIDKNGNYGEYTFIDDFDKEHLELPGFLSEFNILSMWVKLPFEVAYSVQ